MKDGLSYALKILGIKDYFTAEIREKVTRKFDAEEAERVIDTLRSYGYINDERTARNYVSYRLREGYGAYYIASKLYARGYEISNSKIDEIAGEEEIDFELMIKKLADKYLENKDDEPYKLYVKCITYLQSRGFPLQLCLKIVKKGDFENESDFFERRSKRSS